MEENPVKYNFSTCALLVTGFGFILYAFMLSLVLCENESLFWWIGGISFALGLMKAGRDYYSRK